MATLDTEKIVAAVRINLDEIGLNDGDFDASEDEKELDTIIEQKIPWAYAFVVGHCDRNLLGSGMVTTGTATGGKVDTNNVSTNPATLTTGGKVLRFVYAYSANLDNLVYEAIMWDTPEYARLKRMNTTGSKERPLVGIRPDVNKNNDVIEVYGCTSASVAYVEDPTESTSDVELSDALYAAFIYYLTSLTLLTLHESKHAEDMLGQALVMMGVDTTKVSQ